VKDLYNKNYKSLKKEIKEDIRRWKDLCSSIRRINIVKMVILPKAIYMFNGNSSKILMTFFTDIEKSVLKFLWKHKRPQYPKQSLAKRTMLEVIQYVTSICIIDP
jgi:hypothetical protein